MGAVNWLVAEDFSAARASTTMAQEWTGTAGAGASVVACPSGFGWALAKDTSVVNNHTSEKTVANINTVGAAHYLTMGLPTGDATWRLVCILQESGFNNRANLEYRRSTNEYRITRDLSVTITGATFSGPTNPSAAHHVAWEIVRDTGAGQVRAWLDGVQVLNLTGVNTGDGSRLFNRFQVIAPTGGGAGQTTHGNALMWDCSTDPWDGEVKVIQRLAPTSDVAVTGTWTSGSPHWASQDDPINLTSISSAGTAVRMSLSDITVTPAEIYGVVVYGRQQGAGTGSFTIHDSGGDQTTVGTYVAATPYCREVFSGPSGGGDWDKTSLSGLEISIVRNSGSVTFQYAHVLVVRTLKLGVADADLAVTLADVQLASDVQVQAAGLLDVTLANADLTSAVQAGAGVIAEAGADLSIVLQDATLAATTSLAVSGGVAITLDGAALASVAVAGSPGPFPIPPVLIFT